MTETETVRRIQRNEAENKKEVEYFQGSNLLKFLKTGKRIHIRAPYLHYFDQ